MKVRFYFDEDAQDERLIRALRTRDLDILTTTEAGMGERGDSDQLAFAAKQGRVLFSFNVGDYHHIHAEFMKTGHTHSGIVLARQVDYTVGNELRALIHLSGTLTAEQMQNRIEFSSNWR